MCKRYWSYDAKDEGLCHSLVDHRHAACHFLSPTFFQSTFDARHAETGSISFPPLRLEFLDKTKIVKFISQCMLGECCSACFSGAKLNSSSTNVETKMTKFIWSPQGGGDMRGFFFARVVISLSVRFASILTLWLVATCFGSSFAVSVRCGFLGWYPGNCNVWYAQPY